MKRTICLLLAVFLCLGALPAVSATVYEPDDSFYWEHRGECQLHERDYLADGPDNVAVIYRSPLSASVVQRVKNGLEIHISYIWEDAEGFLWGYARDDTGWVPMDYLLLLYDNQCFQAEFPERIEEATGTLEIADVRLWSYPGSDRSETVNPDEPVEYTAVFTDDAGLIWGFVPYCMGVRDMWVCLDDPDADYKTLYANCEPQQVTHPVKQENAALPQIKTQGISLNGILAAVCAISILTCGFFWMTRKKK